jgi:pimeloyl-ACP methyl ester carboxylesterase
VQNQTLSLERDVENTHNVLDLLAGPAILVGHSYGGAVITEAGNHERVAASSSSPHLRPTLVSPSAR